MFYIEHVGMRLYVYSWQLVRSTPETMHEVISRLHNFLLLTNAVQRHRRSTETCHSLLVEVFLEEIATRFLATTLAINYCTQVKPISPTVPTSASQEATN